MRNGPFTCQTTTTTSKTGRRQPIATSVFSHSVRQNDASSLLYDFLSNIFSPFFIFALFCVIFGSSTGALHNLSRRRHSPLASSSNANQRRSPDLWIYKKWTPPSFGCQLMPINRIHSRHSHEQQIAKVLSYMSACYLCDQLECRNDEFGTFTAGTRGAVSRNAAGFRWTRCRRRAG